MEKCWHSKRRRVKLLVERGIDGMLCIGVIVLFFIAFAWLNGAYAQNPNPIITLICLGLGICFGFAIFIGWRISIGIIVLSIIAFVWIDRVYAQYPSIVYACYGFGFGFGLFILIFHGIIGPVEATREYELSDQGITIQYLGRYRRFYSWSSIRKICVCTLFRTSDRLPGELVIWCTTGKIRKEPPRGNRTSWNTQEYILMHFRSVLTMTYTPERLEEFKKYSKREIPDYRDL